MQADLQVALDVKDAEKVLRLVDVLEDLDDVQSVYSNADISEDVMAELEELGG
jgi:transcriptional/translational regulatory protein YebC/TACO1